MKSLQSNPVYLLTLYSSRIQKDKQDCEQYHLGSGDDINRVLVVESYTQIPNMLPVLILHISTKLQKWNHPPHLIWNLLGNKCQNISDTKLFKKIGLVQWSP